jgi:hypothetical protein
MERDMEVHPSRESWVARSVLIIVKGAVMLRLSQNRLEGYFLIALPPTPSKIIIILRTITDFLHLDRSCLIQKPKQFTV